MRPGSKFASALLLVAFHALAAAGPAQLSVDVILVLDNSASVTTNDPQALIKGAVSEFVSSLPLDSRIGIVLFDQDARLVLGFLPVSDPTLRERVSESLNHLDYRGRLTDLPAGVERAIYTLHHHSRQAAKKVVVLLTDGIIQTGSQARNLERMRWLRENLVADAKKQRIRVFGIAFTEKADFQLMQILAGDTDGEYFSVPEAPGLKSAFSQIGQRIREIDLAAPVPTPAPAPTPPQATPQPAAASRDTTTIPEPADASFWRRTPLWVRLTAGLLVLIGLCVLTGVFILVHQGRKQGVGLQPLPTPPSRLSPQGPQGEEQGGQGLPVATPPRAPGGAIQLLAKAFLKDKSSGTIYPLTKDETSIGSSEKTDIVIANRKISAVHACIRFQDGRFHLSDKDSENGTYVNGNRMSVESRVLNDNDEIRIDESVFYFVEGGRTVFGNGGTVTITDPVDVASAIKKPTNPPGQQMSQDSSGPSDIAVVPVVPDTKMKPGPCERHPHYDATEFCWKCKTAKCLRCMNGKPVCMTCLGSPLT